MKKLRIVMVAFVLILSASVVYAASTGSLTINGSATFETDVKLQFIVSGTPQAGQSLTLSAEIPAGEASVDETITIRNTGKLAAKITQVDTSVCDTGITVGAICTSGTPANITVGSEVEYKVTVTWDEITLTAPFSFTITIDYEQV